MEPDRHKPSKESHNSQAGGDLREVVLNKLRTDWKRLAATSIKDYSNLYPQLADDHDFLLDLIYTDVLCREQAGEAVLTNYYVAQFPNLAEAIERQLLVHRSLDDDDEAIDFSTRPADRANNRKASSQDTLVSEQSPSTVVPSGSMKSDYPWPDLPGLRIEAELGRGGMGIVYKAEQLQLKRAVAVKVLRREAGNEDESLSRFRSEAEAIAKLCHPNILQIFDSNVHQGLPFLVLEYIDGDSLTSWCRPPLRPVSTIIRLIELVARAVDYAHQQHIVHRDLKPANILLARLEMCDSSNSSGHSLNCIQDDVTKHSWQPKIADFGLAKQIAKDDQQLTRTQAILGTASYLSPEQAWGRSREVAPSTDIHALGVILYELLTGSSPFQGETLIHTLDNVRFLTPPPPSQLNKAVPAWLDAVCACCLAKEPRDRFASAAALADRLAQPMTPQSKQVAATTSRRWHPIGLLRQSHSDGITKWFGITWQRTFVRWHNLFLPAVWFSVRKQRPRRSTPKMLFAAGTLATFAGVFFALKYDAFAKRSPATGNVLPATTTAGEPPMVQPPEIKGQTTPRKTAANRAFLVGVRAYEFPSGSVQLKYTEADVDEMSRVLNRHGFAREHIQLMTQWSQADNPRLAPSASNLRAQLTGFLRDSVEDDNVIIMLTGMGGETQPQGNYFYLPSDAQLNNKNSLIPLNDFLNLLQECRAKQKLLVFDTCQTVSLPGIDFPAASIPDGVGVLLACSAHQVSYEDDALRHGVFSHYLLRAFEGEGDLDGDHHIRLGELIAFTREQVQNYLSRTNAGALQTPTLIGTLPLETTIVKLPSSGK